MQIKINNSGLDNREDSTDLVARPICSQTSPFRLISICEKNQHQSGVAPQSENREDSTDLVARLSGSQISPFRLTANFCTKKLRKRYQAQAA